MEVKEQYRKNGFGSFIIKQIRKECYLAGTVPAARCNIKNVASKMTLLKGELKIAGYMLLGKVKR
jgi:hypothetical protein